MITTFSLISGMELIADVISETEATYALKDPAQVALQENEDGSMGIMIAAYMPYAIDTITLNKSAVAAYCTPVEALAEEYKSRFEEPPLIQVPGSKKIIL
jgi:hypothetical protein